MYFYDGVWREIGWMAVWTIMVFTVVGAEIFQYRKDMEKSADEAAKKRMTGRFRGRLVLCALAACFFLGRGAYFWQGIHTEDIGSFVGEYEGSRSKKREFGRRYIFVAENGAKYDARLQSKVLYDQMGSIGFEKGKEYRIYFHRRSDIIVGIEEIEE